MNRARPVFVPEANTGGGKPSPQQVRESFRQVRESFRKNTRAYLGKFLKKVEGQRGLPDKLTKTRIR